MGHSIDNIEDMTLPVLSGAIGVWMRVIHGGQAMAFAQGLGQAMGTKKRR